MQSQVMDNLARATHEWLSQRVLLPASHFQQMARPATRPLRAHYFQGMRFRREASGWSLHRKQDWILQRLRFVVRQAYRETVYYRELLDRIGFDPLRDFSFDDYARIPVLEREDVHDAGKRLVSTAIPAGSLRKDATGGSTGTPTEIWMGPEESGWRESAGECFMEKIGVPTGTRTGSFWGHNLDPVGSDNLRDRIHFFAHNVRWFDCFRLSPKLLEEYHQEFQRWRPSCILAYASALGSLAEYVAERRYKPNYPMRCMVTGAEKLLPEHRHLVEQVFQKPVHERYGGRDVGYVAYQINPRQSRDFEIDWANLLVEPETAEPESEILITKLHADGMPMLRYRVNDIGRFPKGSQPGHPALALEEIVGRATDKVFLRDGRWINGIQLPHLMKDFPVREFQLHQKADYTLELKLVPKEGFNGESEQKIREIIEKNLDNLPLNIDIVERVPRTKANKWRPVLTDVKAGMEGAGQ